MSNENNWTIPMHGEFEKRMDDEHTRMNHRINNLEKAVEENSKLALSVERLTMSVQAMVKEQEEQRKQLEAIKGRDGEMWRKVVGHMTTTVIGIVLGYLFMKVGM